MRGTERGGKGRGEGEGDGEGRERGRKERKRKGYLMEKERGIKNTGGRKEEDIQ